MPALMPLFAGVGHRVGLEVRDLNESQAAFLTFVRPFIVVRADVRVEVGGLREGPVAKLARVGFQPGVDAGVEFQVHGGVELGLADGALETLDRTVGHLVTLKMSAVAEPRRTQWTFEGFFLGVGAHVSLHVDFLGERLVADAALEWPDTRVDHHMPGQRACPSERLRAKRTFVGLLTAVYNHVTSQGARLGEPLPARFTLIGFLAGVNAEVLREVALGHTTPSADFTHVRFVASVKMHVNFQTDGMCKCLSANLT